MTAGNLRDQNKKRPVAQKIFKKHKRKVGETIVPPEDQKQTEAGLLHVQESE